MYKMYAMYVCMYVCVCLDVCMYLCMRACIYACMRVCIARPHEFPTPPARSEDQESVAQGAFLYGKHCFRCHGVGVIGTGLVADLRYMTPTSHKLFDDIVRQGIFSSLGMVSFSDVLTKDEAVDIHNYIIDAANDKLDDDLSPQWWKTSKLWVYDKVGAIIGLFL